MQPTDRIPTPQPDPDSGDTRIDDSTGAFRRTVVLGGVLGPAPEAIVGDAPGAAGLLKDGANALFEATGAQKVNWLWQSWIDGPCCLWRVVESLHKDPRAELEQRVAFALRAFFFEFSHLLSQGRVLLLDLEEGRIDRDEFRLEVQNFLGHLRNCGTRCVEIADFQCRLRSANRVDEGAQSHGD